MQQRTVERHYADVRVDASRRTPLRRIWRYVGYDEPNYTDEAAQFLQAFLDHCVRGTNAVTGERGTRLDFISFHTKGTGYRRDPNAPNQTPSMATLVRHVATGLEIANGFPELAGKEVILSECDPDGKRLGEPQQPSPEQVEALQRAARLAPVETRAATVGDGQLRLSTVLPARAVTLLELAPTPEEHR